MIAGVILGAIAIWGLWRDVVFIAQSFYVWAWWSYIIFLDGFCAMRRGKSFFTTRRHLVPVLFFGSITFWFFFEFLNLRFQNWYYVGVFKFTGALSLFAGGVLFVMFAFSTVFIGIFQTYDALNAIGVFKTWRIKPHPLSPRICWAVQGLGLSMAAAAIFFPYYLAPLIWGSVTFLLDPWNYRRGARSLLRDIEFGDWGTIARLLLAGLICGVVWESMNFFAPQKWIYTVRGLENFKIFEMPLLGYFGFPGLALDCMAVYAVISTAFLGGEFIEQPEDLNYELPKRKPTRIKLFFKTVPLQMFFWAVVTFFMIGVNFGSLQVDLNDLSLNKQEIQTLNDAGIHRPRRMLRAFRNPEKRAELQEQLRWSDERMNAVLNEAALYTHKGIGSYYGFFLQQMGIQTPEDLTNWTPEDLHAQLLEEIKGYEEWRHPRLDMVRVWILSARDRSIVLRGGI